MPGPVMTCRLDAVMAERGLSGRRVAEMARTSEIVITRLRRNRFQMVDKDVVGRICAALEITPGELFTVEEG